MNVDAVAARLRDDFSFYGPTCLKIVSKGGTLVPFEPKPAQQRLEDAVRRQQAAGKPVRLIVPKARKEGVSTYSVGKIVQRVTQIANHNAICVAQDSTTAAELLQMATIMHANLPDSETFNVKPPIANRQRKKEIVFGNPSRVQQSTGNMGLNSRLTVDTAGELEAGRGFTYHSLHCSEAAFWPDAKRKLTSLLNAVPDEPTTMIILESTSNGHNHWETLCQDAQEGKNDYEIVFLAWFDDPDYARAFISDIERAEFQEQIGTGPYGAEEPDLLEIHGCSLEQLNWRRWAIANRCQGDLRVFHQEYPSTLEQSFGATGNGVFNPDHLMLTRQAAEASLPPVLGSLHAKSHKTRETATGTVNAPQDPVFMATTAGPWRFWVDPEKIPAEGRYVIGGDPAGDEQTMDSDDLAMHAAQIIDHRTGEQVAELEMQGDPDKFAEQLLLAALLFNRAWVAVETTGGYGYSINRLLHSHWTYQFLYKRRPPDSSKSNMAVQDRLGFDTNRATRPMMIDGATVLLREQSHGIRSLVLVGQMGTFVRDNRGKPVPAPGKRSDALMAWMIAQHIRSELPIRRHDADGSKVVNTSTHRVRYTRTGW